MMAFQDITMKSDSIVPSSKYSKNISMVILQENRWSVSKATYSDQEVKGYKTMPSEVGTRKSRSRKEIIRKR
jgi:hypothetical protein